MQRSLGSRQLNNASLTLWRYGTNGPKARCAQDTPSSLRKTWVDREALLDENSAASTHETPCLTGESLCQLVTWELPRTADIPTFKAEAPRTTEEGLEDIVCIKICGARWETGKEQGEKIVWRGTYDTEIGSPKRSFPDTITFFFSPALN